MTLNILFVDDEARILSAFRRQLRQMRRQWTVQTAQGGEEALALMRDTPIDVVISDMRMPGMDGAELLEIVSEIYPRTVRIVLSGHSDREMAARAVKAAHQFLSKPCSFAHLKESIEQALILRDILRNEKLQALVGGTAQLPSLPDLYFQLVEELRQEQPSLERIGRIVARDVSMTARILQLINSPYFGLRYEIRNINHAVNYLGLDTLKSLVLLIHVFESSLRQTRLLQDFCEHSLLVAGLARQICLNEGAELEEADQAFTAGLLHDVGWLVLFHGGFLDVLPCNHDEAKLLLEERKLWGNCHAEVGAYLLCIWGIPADIVRIAAFHHKPSHAERGSISLAAVHAAETLALDQQEPFDHLFLERLGLSEHIGQWEQLYKKMKEKGVRL